MESPAYDYQSQRLDHLGIIAGICRQIDLVDIIDTSLPTPSNRKVSCGQATLAMVLNALGLTGRALYLMPEYMRNKPVDLLIDPSLEANDFNDDTLGRALDELFQAGVTELFARIAAHAVEVFGIASRFVHVDTSSFHVHGTYESDLADEAVQRRGAIEIRHGYSKQHRPDLKQLVVSFAEQSALPLWLEVLNGNSNDKKSLPETVSAYCRQLDLSERPCFIMDSGGYSASNLAQCSGERWLSRVPETIAEAKQALRSIPIEQMREVGDGYRIDALESYYGDVAQRWLVVYSEKAWHREIKQLDHRIQKAGQDAEKTLRQLSRRQFACQADAEAAVEQLGKKMSWHGIEAAYEPIKKYGKRGRPAQGARAQTVGFRVRAQLIAQTDVIEQARRWKGRFILATNDLDKERLSEEQMLAMYKSQSYS